MPDSFHLEHLALLLLGVHSMRLWWRLNRRRMQGWFQRVKDHLPIHRHPKSPKDCAYCQGVHLEKVVIPSGSVGNSEFPVRAMLYVYTEPPLFLKSWLCLIVARFQS